MRIIQDMYEGSETAAGNAVGKTEGLKVQVGLNQGSVLSQYLNAVVMDRLRTRLGMSLLGSCCLLIIL